MLFFAPYAYEQVVDLKGPSLELREDDRVLCTSPCSRTVDTERVVVVHSGKPVDLDLPKTARVEISAEDRIAYPIALAVTGSVFLSAGMAGLIGGAFETVFPERAHWNNLLTFGVAASATGGALLLASAIVGTRHLDVRGLHF